MLQVAHHTCTHYDASTPKRARDPCQCTDLRQRLQTYFRKATLAWRKDVYTALVTDDALALSKVSMMSVLPHDRLERFSAFARASAQQRTATIEEQVSGVLASVYVRGVKKAFGEAKKVPPTASTTSSVAFYVKQTMNDMQGVIDESTKLVNRQIALGVASKDSAYKLYLRLAPIFLRTTLHRLMLTASTMVSTAYNGGKLDAYEELGMKTVKVIAEDVPPTRTDVKDASFARRGSRNVFVTVLTAGDDLVCPLCEDLEGITYSLSAARGLLPVHPNCRCVVVPEDDARFADVPFRIEE